MILQNNAWTVMSGVHRGQAQWCNGANVMHAVEAILKWFVG